MSVLARLDGKTALVTGASSGLGYRFAEVLARAGAKVALAARRTDRLEGLARAIEGFDGRAVPIRCDIADPASIREAVEAAETELGPIGILVNNAGITVQRKVVDVTPEDYDQVMNVNARGAFFTAQEVGRRMIQHGLPGRIVNISSTLGLKAMSQLAVYCMSKAATVQMTKVMALEWARYGINVNAICPGYIETELNADYWATDGGKKLTAMLPRRRGGRPSDRDAVLLLLASGEESRFLNGAIINVDDGLTYA